MEMQMIKKENAAKMLFNRFKDQIPITEHQLAECLEYYAWPQAFGSTSGPFGGVGGQVITSFTIEAWAFCNFAILFCGAKALIATDKFQPLMKV